MSLTTTQDRLLAKIRAATETPDAIKVANGPLPGPRPNPRIRLLEKVGKVKIWLVNEKLVRDHWFRDFEQGTNGKAFPEYCPEDEIWVGNKNGNEALLTKLHEMRERDDMVEHGWPYSKAHPQANAVELYAALHPEHLQLMLRAERERMLALQRK